MIKLTNNEILSAVTAISPLASITKSGLVAVKLISLNELKNMLALFSLVELDNDFYGNKETGVYMTLNTRKYSVSLAFHG